MQVTHPNKICVPVEQALREWRGAGHFEIKFDGVFTVREVTGGILVGETVGNRFTAFDCVERGGWDIRVHPLDLRLRARGELCHANGIDEIPSCESSGSDFLERTLAAGLEGVCLKSPGSYYDAMVCAKRNSIYLCRVTEAAGARQSVRICDLETGVDRGCVPAKGGAADVLRYGDRVRVEAFAETASGKLREARLCREYLVK